MQFDTEPGYRLAGFLDAVDHAAGPSLLDADHHHSRDIRVRSGADQGTEMQFEILTELQPAVGMRNRERAFDIVRHGFAGRIRKVIQRQDDDMVAHADAAVFSPPPPKFHVRFAVRSAIFLRHVFTTAWS